MSRHLRVLIVALAGSGLLWTGYDWLTERVSRAITDRSFYGSLRQPLPDDAARPSAVSNRHFHSLLGESDAGQNAQSFSIPIDAQAGTAVGLRIVQADSSSGQAPILTVRLNDGPAQSIPIVTGAGRDPVSTERGAPHHYTAQLAGTTTCGRNWVVFTATGSGWVALERVDVVVPDGRRVRGIVGLLAALSLIGILVSRRPTSSLSVQRPRLAMSEAAARVSILLVSVAVALVAVEVMLTIAARMPRASNVLLHSSTRASPLTAAPEILTALQAHRCAGTPCSIQPCGFRLNSAALHTHDYQIPKTPGTRRIVGIGDSFMAYGGPVPHELSLFGRIESETKATPAEAINLGQSCIGIPSEKALFDQEALRLSPDVVVWSVYLGNDVTDEVTAPSGIGTESFIDRFLLTRLVVHVGELIIRDPKWLGGNCVEFDKAPDVVERGCGRLERSHPIEDYDAQAKTFSDEAYATYAVGRFETMYAASRQRHILALTADLVERFRGLRNAHGTRLFEIVVIPDQFQVSDDEVDRILTMRPELRLEDPQFGPTHQAVVDGLRALGFSVIDLKEPFEAALRSGIDPYQPNDSHLSLDGNRIAAELVLTALRERGIL